GCATMRRGLVYWRSSRRSYVMVCLFFFFQAEDGIRDLIVTGVQTCALPIFGSPRGFRCRIRHWISPALHQEVGDSNPRFVLTASFLVQRFANSTCPVRTDRFSFVLFALGPPQLRVAARICSLKFSKSSATNCHTSRPVTR